MTHEPPSTRGRVSIEERAARRRELIRDHPDRFSALVDVLLHTRTTSLGPATDVPARWHPIAGKLVLATLLVVGLVAIFYVGNSWLREGRIDTWSGPTGDVTSGQRVLDCLPATTLTDTYLPTWIRLDGGVYGNTGRLRPLLGWEEGQTTQVETGYRLDRMRILLPAQLPAGEVPPRIYVVVERGLGATIYERASSCA